MNEDLVRQIPIFTHLPPEEVKLLARSFHPVEYRQGEVLFREGDTGDSFLTILEGQVEIFLSLDNAGERILGLLGPGEYFGELSLLDPRHVRSAAARALTPIRLLKISSVDFNQLSQRQPSLAVEFLRNISLRLRNSEMLTIHELEEKNSQLTQALLDLQAAQVELIKKEQLEQELRLARVIQESFLPKQLPDIPGWDVSAYWQPAHEVGGDFYDLIPLNNGSIGLLIGDVAGKGMPAALMMATTRSLLHFAVQTSENPDAVSPGEVLAQVNELCYTETPPEMFITCLFMVLNPTSGYANFANAGQNLPFHCSAQGVSELIARGMPLGLMPGMEYEETETRLSAGDMLVMFSDGLVEAHNAEREMYGAQRFRESLACRLTSHSLIPHLLDSLTEFTSTGIEQEDDITCLALKRLY